MLAIAMVGAVGALSAGCGDRSGSGARAGSASTGARCRGSVAPGGMVEAEPDRTSAVSRYTVTLIDRRRTTPAIPGRPTSSCRSLRTEVRYPSGSAGALPLLVVAHGLDGHPSSLAPLLDAWAAAGYVVAAPTFPTTSKDGEGESRLSESVDQAADMSFVIDQMLARSRARTPSPVRGRIDARRIGAAGMSLGGLSVYGMVSNTCCRDRRVKAAILMAAVRRQFPDERYEENEVPVLIVQGDADRGYHNSVEAYPELVPPKWFITLHGSGHSPPFEVPPGPEAPLVYATTTRFWDRYLQHDRAAARQIVDAVRASRGQATLRRELG